jgi:DNA-binding MurR/RpiR family transcriptional regulator
MRGGRARVQGEGNDYHRPLECGRVRMNLIHELGIGEMTQAELGRKYGVNPASICRFAKKHELEILDVKDKVSDAIISLWITRRADRVAEMQQIYDDIDKIIRNEVGNKKSMSDRANLFRTKLTALRQAAEELGQLKDAGNQTQLEITINGVDIEDLK